MRYVYNNNKSAQINLFLEVIIERVDPSLGLMLAPYYRLFPLSLELLNKEIFDLFTIARSIKYNWSDERMSKQ